MTLPCSVAANSSLICVPLVSFLYSTTKHASRLCFWKMLIHCSSIRNNFPVSLLDSLTIQSGCTCELTYILHNLSSSRTLEAMPLRNYHIQTQHLLRVTKLNPRACFLPYWKKACDFGFFHHVSLISMGDYV